MTDSALPTLPQTSGKLLPQNRENLTALQLRYDGPASYFEETLLLGGDTYPILMDAHPPF